MSVMTLSTVRDFWADNLTLPGTRKPSYRSSQRFVEAQYAKAHSARISCDFPRLLSVLDEQQTTLAVAGIRTPDQPFFLEHYLDCSAEQSLGEQYGCSVKREKIVEIGNLAGGKDRYATEFLMHRLWDHLVRSGYEYLLLTGTRPLLRHFRSLPLHHLADAKADRIPNASQWGSYYEKAPRVVVGRLSDYDFRYLASRTGRSYYSELFNSKVQL